MARAIDCRCHGAGRRLPAADDLFRLLVEVRGARRGESMACRARMETTSPPPTQNFVDIRSSTTTPTTTRRRRPRLSAEAHPLLAHHFESLDQQREASSLAMWVFLVTEIMFFGGLFLAYVVYRWMYPTVFVAGSHHLDVRLGGLNTAILIASSLTMALGVRAAQLSDRKALTKFMVLTLFLGLAFLGIKAIEYHDKFAHHLIPGPNFHMEGPSRREVQIFFSLYFAMTGLHALHMTSGGLILWRLLRRVRCSGRYGPSTTIRSSASAVLAFVDTCGFSVPALVLIGGTLGWREDRCRPCTSAGTAGTFTICAHPLICTAITCSCVLNLARSQHRRAEHRGLQATLVSCTSCTRGTARASQDGDRERLRLVGDPPRLHAHGLRLARLARVPGSSSRSPGPALEA